MRRSTAPMTLACLWFGALSNAYAEAGATDRGTPLASLSKSAVAESSVRSPLAAAVLSRLQGDPIVDARSVDVTAADGIITLTGTQSLLLACDRATYIAETVPSVRAVVNRLSVRQLREADTQTLESDVLYMLLTDPATRHNRLLVSTNALGQVTLSGTVSNYPERSLAGQVVRGVAGVTGVTNRIEIANPRPRRDQQIVADVRRALAWDAYVDSRHIDVSAAQGVVRLAGKVDSAAQKRRSVALSWVTGVRAVNAKALQVVGALAAHGDASRTQMSAVLVSDKDIMAAVNHALRGDPRLRGDHIQVEVRDRVVILEGTVDSLAAKRVADTLVHGLRGIASVENRLHVPASAQIFSDAEIESRIERSLARNGATQDDAIGISVVDAAVTLEGDASNWLSRQIAENAAASVQGVHEVINRIVVADGADTLSFNPYVDAGPVAWTND